METLKDLLSKKFDRVNTRGEFFYFRCPFCSKVKRYVSQKGGVSKCWVCGNEHQVDIAELLRVPNSQIKYDKKDKESKPLHDMARVLPYKSAIPVNELKEDHPTVQFLYKDHLFDLNSYATDYGISFIDFPNGIPIEFEKGSGAKTKIETHESLVFPVTFQNNLVGWQLRYIPNTFYGDRSIMKYFHLFDKGNYLFNYDKAIQYKYVIVVEGVKKALKLPNAVATLGKGISLTQLQLIQQWDNIVMLLDADDKTQETAEKLCRVIKLNGKNIWNINLAKYGFPSPDEAKTEELIGIIEREINERKCI